MANQEVGSAYIEVSAKLDKNAGKDLKKGLEDVDVKDSGKKLGEEVGDGVGAGIDAKAVAIGNIVANVVTAAAQKAAQLIGDVIGGAFENYANYQQLTGGVEKIFDEANIDGIIADASNAYRDLNMSANEYLETINQTGASFAMTMGDQKGYDVARTGMMAIADYASGTGRSLSELNEKYSMITRAASSYQSIADQFSGLLPATSADFLAQAQAAGYLSSEYTKLTEVPIAEYQEAVSLMLQKGVEDMGLAGNTAMESATTISGSLAMLSASWQNWLTAIGGGGDLSEATAALVDSLSTAAENVIPEMGTILGNLIKEIPNFVAVAIEQLPSLATNLADALFGEGAGDAVASVFEEIAPYLDQLIQAVQQMFADLQPFIQTMAPALQSFGGAMVSLLQAIMSALANVLPTVTSFLNWIAPFIAGLFEKLAAFINWFLEDSTRMSGALTGLQAIVETVSTAFEIAATFIQGVWDGLVKFFSAIPMKISSFFSGIAETIGGYFRAAYDKVTGIATDIVNFWRDVPSKITGFFSNIGSAITGFFKNIKLPHIKVDNFSLNPVDWVTNGVPKLWIEWAATGGLVDGATLIGAGEAGREAIVPLENRSAMQPFATAVSEDLQDNGTFADILAVLVDIRDRTQAVYLDKEAVGRVMAPGINKRIGNNSVMVSRGGGAYAF